MIVGCGPQRSQAVKIHARVVQYKSVFVSLSIARLERFPLQSFSFLRESGIVK